MQLIDFGDPTGESEFGFDWMHTVGLLGRLQYVNRATNWASGQPRTLYNLHTGSVLNPNSLTLWLPSGANSLESRWNLSQGNLVEKTDRAVDFFSLLFHNGDITDAEKDLSKVAYLEGGGNANRLRYVVSYMLSLPAFQKQ